MNFQHGLDQCMKIGISITSAYQTSDARSGAQQMLARTRAAASAGLDSLFVGDHHAVPSPYYQNVPMMGRLLAEWDNRASGALFLLPLWNPVLAAEQISTLACIAEGKFIMQCGLGAGKSQFSAMGTNIKFRPSAFEQCLESMRALWAGESVTLDGRWKFSEAKISPLPPEPIDVWIGASAPVAIERAAKLGDAWLANPSMLLDEASKTMDFYIDALAKASKPVPETIAIRRDIYVAESTEDTIKTREEVLNRGYRGFDPDALVIGTADAVAASFEAFGELGYTDIIVRNLHSDGEKAVASTERLSEVRKYLVDQSS
jgi:alkanesulfonate monooxygenase SsuD/methylene tetrahydromethanopterin reductase-like flavin-dependent oxidoreductase (luciferase family)